MNKIILIPLVTLLLLAYGHASAQQGEQAAPQQQQGEMPKLEIPEITIVGKKAITLPFARKGEVYDVEIYAAPPPDSSLLEGRPQLPLPLGSLGRYEERRDPWRIAAEGTLGTLSTGKARAYIDYTASRWNIVGQGGFGTTGGHVENADATSFDADVRAQSLLATDNDMLKTLRLSLGTRYQHDSYGIFGVALPGLDRRRDNTFLRAQLGSVERRGTVIDFALGADIWNITDTRAAVDTGAAAVSPELDVSFAADAGPVRWTSNVRYSGSSLDYLLPVQSPSMIALSTAGRWRIGARWLLELGGMFASGSGVDGEDETLLLPTALIRWELRSNREFSVWWKPELHLATFGEALRATPYLEREFALLPERAPANIGATFWHNETAWSLELRASYRQSTNRPVILADGAGTLQLGYVDALQTALEFDGMWKPRQNTRVRFSGVLQRANEEDGDEQLPMTPVARLQLRGELDLRRLPVTVWSSLEYASPRTVDRAGAAELASYGLLGAGASTHIVPRTVLSLELANLLDAEYEWWSGYPAPGIQLYLHAQVNLR